MSVIVENKLTKQFSSLVKGSPEKIEELSIPESCPSDYKQVLRDYTMKGYRVIALAYKPLDFLDESGVQELQREAVERDLIFLGFLVM